MTIAEQVTEPVYELAEGPVWDAPRERLVWVDILEGLVLEGRLSAGSVDVTRRHAFDSYVGAAAVAADGSLLVADLHRLTCLAPDGIRTSGPDLFADHPGDRWNDGVCDARGRFLVGTVSLTGARHSQRLLSIDGETTTVLDDDLGLANGMAFSPDDTLLYTVDSLPGRRVWVRDYDPHSGTTGPRRLAFELSDAVPDGLCVDASGHLWLAAWSKGQVRCYSPTGDLLDVIDGLPRRTRRAWPSSGRTSIGCSSPPPAASSHPRSRRSTRCRGVSSSPGQAVAVCPATTGPDVSSSLRSPREAHAPRPVRRRTCRRPRRRDVLHRCLRRRRRLRRDVLRRRWSRHPPGSGGGAHGGRRRPRLR